jgi:hypothetical protein
MADTDELELIRVSARHLLQTAGPAEIPDALMALGWTDVLDAGPAAAVTAVAEEQGRLRAVSPILDVVMQHAAGIADMSSTALLLPPISRRGCLSATESDGDLLVDGIALAGRGGADTFLGLTEPGIAVIDGSVLKRTPIRGADPELGLTAVTGTVDMSSTGTIAPAPAVDAALVAGRLWLASELIGLAATMLTDTIAYVSARHQFGRPIAAFQTVKHRLADVHVAITAARAGTASAWLDTTLTSATAAKCLAALAHDAASTHCHQVHGGIAFTVEHGFHGWIRRGQTLDALLGSRRDLTRFLGRSIIAAGAFPRTPQLADVQEARFS